MPRRIHVAVKNRLVQRNFQWSYQPILSWINLIGIPLNLADGGFIRNKFAFVYSILLFAKNITLIINFFAQLIVANDPFHKISLSTIKWSVVMKQITDLIAAYGTHCVLITFTLVKWKDLAKILRHIEQLNLFDSVCYKQFRCIILYGLLIVILVYKYS